MPNVMGREFPYTPEGIAAAERYEQAVGMRNGGMMGFRPLGHANGGFVDYDPGDTEREDKERADAGRAGASLGRADADRADAGRAGASLGRADASLGRADAEQDEYEWRGGPEGIGTGYATGLRSRPGTRGAQGGPSRGPWSPGTPLHRLFSGAGRMLDTGVQTVGDIVSGAANLGGRALGTVTEPTNIRAYNQPTVPKQRWSVQHGPWSPGMPLNRLFSFAGDRVLNPIVQAGGDVVSGFRGAGEPGGIGMRDGGMMGFRPLGYADGDLVAPLVATGVGQRAAASMMGAPADVTGPGSTGVPVSDTPVGGSESISNAIDTIRSLVQEFLAQDIPDPVKAAVNAAIGVYGIPIDLVTSALDALGLPVSETPFGGSTHLKETFGFDFSDLPPPAPVGTFPAPESVLRPRLGTFPEPVGTNVDPGGLLPAPPGMRNGGIMALRRY
jgi:hypothetical protein